MWTQLQKKMWTVMLMMEPAKTDEIPDIDPAGEYEKTPGDKDDS